MQDSRQLLSRFQYNPPEIVVPITERKRIVFAANEC